MTELAEYVFNRCIKSQSQNVSPSTQGSDTPDSPQKLEIEMQTPTISYDFQVLEDLSPFQEEVRSTIATVAKRLRVLSL